MTTRNWSPRLMLLLMLRHACEFLLSSFTRSRTLCSILFRPLGVITLVLWVALFSFAQQTGEGKNAEAIDGMDSPRPSLEQLKASGLNRSRFSVNGANRNQLDLSPPEIVQTDSGIADFRESIEPLLDQHCIDCHGDDSAEANLRVDTLDPDLIHGPDTDWWNEIFAVITKGEMPPPDTSSLDATERETLVTWLSSQLHTASRVRQRSGAQSSFRRLTRYEYNYALQDLLGLPFDFAKDLPPEPQSEEGFENNAEQLRLSVSQFETYYRIARNALSRAVATGDQPPTKYWHISMRDAGQREWSKQDAQINKLHKEFQEAPDQLKRELEKLQKRLMPPNGAAYYYDQAADRRATAEWNYRRAQYAFEPTDDPASPPSESDCVAILPHGTRSRLIFELGNQLPDQGIMRVTVRATKANAQSDYIPSLQLFFGWQASNEGRALLRVSQQDTPITGTTEQPQVIQWDVPLGEIYPRNSVRKTSPMGSTPSPSEYIRLINSSATQAEIQIESVRVAAPVYDQWPPESHRRIFLTGDSSTSTSKDDQAEARKIIGDFMQRAWRRPIREEELNRKMALYSRMRPSCESFEEAISEVLATVLSSPPFLFVGHQTESSPTSPPAPIDPYALATRLATFLWCSIPDSQLISLAQSGQLAQPTVLAEQVDRMLNDPRCERMANHFVHQWLNLDLLAFQNFRQQIRGFDPLLKEAMQQEPIAMFQAMLREDNSLLDLIHCDYAFVNERLARHYGWPHIHGNHFRRIELGSDYRRGGLLTQAGLLAMNSDWPDSHPLKRAIWLLESVLGDPPPPPPPAVPQIDLADPEIAKMTLKERIEDHRNHAACLSCHIKIDPWGIAFENYDALGRWRNEINGKPVEASSELFNHQTLDGMEGLKRFLLEHRQDQFIQAMVNKLATYGLGRPMTFADQAELEAIASQVRHRGDGLRTIVKTIAQSKLFLTP